MDFLIPRELWEWNGLKLAFGSLLFLHLKEECKIRYSFKVLF